MALRDVALQFDIETDEADLVESLFNQYCETMPDDQKRRERAVEMVKVFSADARDRAVLARHLIDSRDGPPSGA